MAYSNTGHSSLVKYINDPAKIQTNQTVAQLAFADDLRDIYISLCKKVGAAYFLKSNGAEEARDEMVLFLNALSADLAALSQEP